MKLKFKQQPYQTEAANAVVKIFEGQPKGSRIELVGRTGLFTDEIFSNKKIELSETTLLHNVKEVQKTGNITPDQKLVTKDGIKNFTTEMETGTGKTYVYIKTIFELNEKYGWNKFIVMVPSVAIREGVRSSFDDTAEHFQGIYGKKIRTFIYDTKNNSNLVNIKSFASTTNIEVIIMNYQAFASRSQESKKIFQELDSIGTEKPINIIKRARPILIIDEPQRFGPTAEATIKEFNPLFILRYSATHRENFNKIYRLDAIDSYNHKLVKKISVKGIAVISGGGTGGYIYVDHIDLSKTSYPTALIEIEVKTGKGIKRQLTRIKNGDNLFDLSNGLQQYKGYVVNEIDGRTDGVTFLNGVEIDVGEVTGDVNEDQLRRIQIRETIKSHIEKERQMFKRGIKVLSLFFIDEVSKYRKYDENGNLTKGEYEEIFEEEYNNEIAQKTLFDDEYNQYLESFKTEKVHSGYFSIDKKGKYINSSEGRDGGSDDTSAYELIMKKKGQLLDFKEPTRFIFSHSALREGWDNPNIFQICTLKHTQADVSRRQEIGRGLRVCVNQNGDRMDYTTLENEFFEYNTLTVVANESYHTFANSLQKEIMSSLTDRPTELTADVFQNKTLVNELGERYVFDNVSANKLVMKFTISGYLDENLKVTEKMIEAIDSDILEIPEELKPYKNNLYDIIKKVHGTATFKATSNGKIEDVQLPVLNPNENFNKKEFQELWNKIKAKTAYEVHFDNTELIANSIREIDSSLEVAKLTISIQEGTQEDELSRELNEKVTGLRKTKDQILQTSSVIGNVSYDLLDEIIKASQITRKTAAEILTGISKLKFAQFKENPEDFIRKVGNIIREQKAATLINSIKYTKTNQSYDDDIFTINNFHGSLRENLLKVSKHVYDYVKTDSEIERQFAEDLETGEISVYAKLPGGFKIPTPIGNYNPDWAIVFDSKDVKYVYFVAETKGSMSTMSLKKEEDLKIKYARKHFESLNDSSIRYDVVSTYEDLRNKVL